MNHVDIREIVSLRFGRDWCLFLDRDGVINRRVIGDYVRNWRQFVWLDGAEPALKILREWAPRIVIVTNQQGVGKGLMSDNDVEKVHRELRARLAASGVLIDSIEVCPHLQSKGCECRKPQPGLAMKWLARHTSVDPALSIVAGDSPSDIEFARQLAKETGECLAVGIGCPSSDQPIPDISFASLWDFAAAVQPVLRAFSADPSG